MPNTEERKEWEKLRHKEYLKRKIKYIQKEVIEILDELLKEVING